MSDDFYDQAARRQYATLQAARSQVVANLEGYRAGGDDWSASQEIQTLATLDSQMADLQRLHSKYQASRNPAPVPEMTEAEWQAASPEAMARNPAMVERLFERSKYYKRGDMEDPEARSRFFAGIEEVNRRKREEGGNR
jgi:hypothetical protein